MKIFVKVKPSAKQEAVDKINGNHFVVKVKEPPIQGKANKALIRALAGYFEVPISTIRIISGEKSKQKIVALNRNTI